MAKGRYKDTEMARIVQTALDELEKFGDRSIYVQAKRARNRNLNPTEHQDRLLKFIQKKGFVTFEMSLGMHFGMLGGLLARGLAVPVKENGRNGYRVR